MGTREKCLRLLRCCFKEEEWAWLQEKEEFQQRLTATDRLEEIEPTITAGLRLLARARGAAYLSLIPSSRRDPLEKDGTSSKK